VATITRLDVLDVRFPTSRSLDGSDAMNPDPDYSAAYVVLRTDAGDGFEGHGLTFTIGRGTEVVVAGVRALQPLVLGRSVEDLARDMGAFWRDLVGDSQLRWIGPDRMLAVDANQRWDVAVAIDWMRALAPFDPYWIEEPTSPDDILGHAAIARAVAPIRVATGEHVHNRVMFKQLFQAQAIGVCQIDACRLGGVNEVVAVLLLAAKFGVPVCPHAGGVGLCELVQHLSIVDYIAISGGLEGRMIEYVDHLHEHFLEPVVIRDGRYVVPQAPGYGAEMRPESLSQYAFPAGAEWATAAPAPAR
jgi:L-alanine-DL-glutamate epimerase-like enolase superfamily enzyme